MGPTGTRPPALSEEENAGEDVAYYGDIAVKSVTQRSSQAQLQRCRIDQGSKVEACATP